MDIIFRILGDILKWIYDLTNNFGVAIILFTILIRAILMPLMVKQQKSMAHMQKIQPKLNEIQKKYQNDKTKLNEETMKLYKEHGVNPMGGCLPMLFQFPILIAVYGVIQNPMTYILKFIPKLPENLPTVTALCEHLKEMKMQDTELAVVAFVSSNMEKAKEIISGIGVNTEILSKMVINFNFLGIDLGKTPSADKSNYLLLLIPVLCGVTTFISSKLTAKLSGNNAQKTEQSSQMQTMQMIFPFMSAFFGYTLPAALGLYWIIGNVLQILQSLTLDRFIMQKEADNPLVIEKAERTSEKKKKKGK